MKTIALRRLAEINPSAPAFDRLPEDGPVLFLPLETVWADARADQSRRVPKSTVSTGYTRFHAGDVVSPKVTPTFQAGRSMIAQATGAGTTELHILRAAPGVDPRWIAYALRSKHFLREGVTAFEGVAGLQRVPQRFLEEFRVADVPGDLQRRIADFLDERVASIDQIIASRRGQRERTNELGDREWSRATQQLAGELVPLRRFLRSITDGPFGSSLTSQHYADTGTRVIRLGNLGVGEFRVADHACIPDDYAEALAQHAVRPGDLIMAGLGDDTWPLGRSAVVPDDFGPAIVKADCYRIRLDERVDHHFAALALSSPDSRVRIKQMSRGSTRARLNTELARAIPIPFVSPEAQRVYIRQVVELRREVAARAAKLERSAALMSEYKQSLITAAVTGEFDVTTASTKIPGEHV